MNSQKAANENMEGLKPVRKVENSKSNQAASPGSPEEVATKMITALREFEI